MFEQFPYTDMHQLNLDWIVKIAKDFLDQYTNIQQLITEGQASLENVRSESLQEISDKLTESLADLAAALSADIQSINTHTTERLDLFDTAVDVKTAAALASIPDDYTNLSDKVVSLENAIVNNSIITKEVEPYTILTDSTGNADPTIYLFYTSGYIPVIPGTTYITKQASRTCYYNSSKAYVGNAARDINSFTVPAGVAYVRITWYQDHANNYSNYLIPSGAEPIIINIMDLAKKINSILAGYPNSTIDVSEVIEYKILNDSTGELTDTTYLFYTTGFIPVLCDADYSCAKASRICFYDINKTYIGTHTRDVTTIHTQAGAYYMRFSWYYLDCPKEFQYASIDANHTEFNLKNIRNRYDIYNTGNIMDFYNQMEYCFNKGNLDVYIHEGTYTFTNSLIETIRQQNKRGIRIGNNNNYYFDVHTSVICIYTGTETTDVAMYFSPFDSDNTGGNFELHNLILLAKNVLYGVHDEMAASTIPSHHKFVNCYIVLDNSQAASVSFDHAIGGGFGANCLVEHINGVYESVSNNRNRDVSYHGNNNGDYSRLVVTGCYFAHTLAFDTPVGINRKELMLSNNSIASDFQITTDPTLIVHKWNNEIRP